MSATNPARPRATFRDRFTLLPGVVVVVVVLFWCADLAVRGHLSGGQSVWLLIVAGALALLSLPVLLPFTWLLERLARGATSRIAVYVAAFGAIGFGIGLATDAVSMAAAVAGGATAGLLTATLTPSAA